MWSRILKEPVAIMAALRAVVFCAAAFGLELSGEQIAALMLAVEAVLGLVTRAMVSPVDEMGELREPPGMRVKRP